jgi:hypothetical protein
MRESYLTLGDWGAGDHAYRGRLEAASDGEPPGPDSEPAPWTIEFTIAATPLDA